MPTVFLERGYMPVNTANSTAYALNVGAVGVVGTFLGMPLDALILGAMAGAVAYGLNRAVTRPNGIATIITSTLLAGAFSPAIIGFAIHQINLGESSAEIAMLKPLVPVLIGAGWIWAMPHIADGLKRIWGAIVDKCVQWFGGKS